MTPKNVQKALIERKIDFCFNLSDQIPLKPSNWFFSISCHGVRTFKVVWSRCQCYLGCNLAEIIISGHGLAPIGRYLDSKHPIEPSRGVYKAVKRF